MTWLPALGALATVLAALIAGTFAFYRLRRSLAAQRALEEEKAAAQRALERERIVTSSRESELTELRAARREYQQSRVLPFLEQLNKALIESYATVAFPPYFRDLAAHIPQTRGYADKAINEWLGATEQMSRYRMQLLLVLSEEMIPPVTSLLTEFMDLTRQLIRTRDEVWRNVATPDELRPIQREYVRTGYRLMMEIKDAAMSVPVEESPLSTEAKEEVAETLSEIFEKVGVISVPSGSAVDFSWLALWEVDTRPEYLQWIASRTGTTHEVFEENLMTLTKELGDLETSVDVQLIRVPYDSGTTYCLAVKLPSNQLLQEFMEKEIVEKRGKYPNLWSPLRAPREYTLGLESNSINSPAEPQP